MTADALRHAALADANAPAISRSRIWTGRVLSGLSALFLIADGAMKLRPPVQVTQAFQMLGMPIELAPVIGTILLVCVAVYLVPRTAVLGALLLTAYLGGAVAVQLRAGTPLFETLFPTFIAIAAWLGLYLREPRLRALLPVRSE